MMKLDSKNINKKLKEEEKKLMHVSEMYPNEFFIAWYLNYKFVVRLMKTCIGL